MFLRLQPYSTFSSRISVESKESYFVIWLSEYDRRTVSIILNSPFQVVKLIWIANNFQNWYSRPRSVSSVLHVQRACKLRQLLASFSASKESKNTSFRPYYLGYYLFCPGLPVSLCWIKWSRYHVEDLCFSLYRVVSSGKWKNVCG